MGTLIRTDLSLFEERTDEITSKTSYKDVKEAIAILKNELHREKDLVCLCAPQVNKQLRIFVVKNANNVYKAFLNPMIVNASKEMHLSRETNASIPGKEYLVVRNNTIHLAYQQPDGRIDSETYTGVYAEVIQQMVQMLDGVTLEDFGLELTKGFDKASKADKQTIIQMYLESLKQYSATLSSDIENNPNLKLLNDTINFNTKYLNGEIIPLDENGNEVLPKVDE
jgi:peptide deformylase